MLKMTDEQLEAAMPIVIQNERKAISIVLEHIAEVDRRRLYLKWNFASLFDCLTKRYKYSESAANRRISAARVLHKMPELLDDVQSGELNLTQIAMVQASVRQEEKAGRVRIDTEKKKEIFEAIKSMNTSQTQIVLDEKLPNREAIIPVTEQHKRDESVELTLRIPKELFDEMKEVKDLYSHISPGANWVEIIRLMAKDVKKLRDKKRDVKRPTSATEVKKAATAPRPIRRFVFQRDHGKCQHAHADGSKCGSTFQVEVDHITPRFAGGDDSLANLRVLCRTHNQARSREGAGIRQL